jgi:hypothetical protein
MVGLLKKRKFRRPVGVPSQSDADKTLVGLSPEALKTQGEASGTEKKKASTIELSKVSIRTRKTTLKSKVAQKKFRRPNAVERALAEDVIELPMTKLDNPYQLPGIYPCSDPKRGSLFKLN